MAGAAYVGTTQGDFSIEAGGSASFSIPIQVPPGTARMQPALSLLYVSGPGGGESLVGNGWNLHGLSQITRCAATLAQDGRVGGVRFDDDDRFSLDGARLQPVQGSYGAADAVYHTEIESWRKVVPVFGPKTAGRSGPDAFQVFERDGHVLDYGGTPDSQLAASPSNPSIRVWALNRVTDRLGNALTIRYTQDADNGACYPARIDYTLNGAMPARRAVTFEYEPRPDVMPRHVGGSRIAYVQRLASVSTWLDGALVRVYSLSYATGTATGRSQLVAVTEAGADGNALPPLVFRWQDGNEGIFAGAQLLPAVSVPAGGEWLPVDVNGDGLVDIVHVASGADGALSLHLFVNQGTAFAPPSALAVPELTYESGNALPMDVNADGCIELVYAAAPGGQLGLTVFAAVADASAPGGWRLAATGAVNGAGPDGLAYGGELLPMDVNGDGCVDLVYATTPGGTSIALQELISTGTSFTLGPATQSSLAPGGSFIPLDFDGDGLADLVYAWRDGPDVRLALFLSVWGQGLQQQAASPFAAPLPLVGGGSFVPFDVNGDGLGDLVYLTQDEADQSLQLYTLVSNGRTFVLEQGGAPQKPGLGFGGTVLPMDVNGDGLCELVVASAEGASVRLDVLAYDGRTFNRLSGVRQALADRTWGGNLVPLDLAGTGKTGLVYATGSAQVRFTCASPAGPYPDLVVGIENGLNGVVTITYKPLTDPTVYRRSAPAAARVDAMGLLSAAVPGSTCGLDPAGGLQAASSGATPATRVADFPKYVVAGHVLDEGAGTQYAFNRVYASALIDLRGRGWLGYAAIDSVDVDAQVATRTEYEQAFPLTGLPALTQILTPAGALLHSTANTYAAAAPRPWPAAPVADVHLTRLATEYFSAGQATPDRSEAQDHGYDDYGNRTTLAETGTGLPAPLYTLDDYANDAQGWLLGLKTQSRKCADAGGATVLAAERSAYDANGLVQAKSAWIDTADLWLTTTYAYDPYGNPVAETDPSGATTRFVIEAEYNTFVARTLLPPNASGVGVATTSAYDARFGTLTVSTDANGVARTKVYDGLGRMIELRGPDPAGADTSLATYGWIVADGRTYEETRRRGDWAGTQWPWTRELLDGFGRSVDTLSLAADGAGIVRVDRTLDSRNQMAGESLPYREGDAPATVTRSFDALGRVLRVQRPAEDGTTSTTIAWTATDAATQVEAAGTPLARSTSFTFGGFGGRQWMLSRTAPDGGITTYEYDALRRLVRITDPGSVVTERAYDSLGRSVATRRFRGGRTYEAATHVFDDRNRTVRSADAAGNVVTVTHDALQRVIRRDAAAPEGAFQTTYAYDGPGPFGLGRLASVTDSRGSYAYAYSYDACGNEAVTTLTLEGRAYATKKTYQPTGSVAQVVLPDGSVQQNDYLPGGGWGRAALLDDGAATASVAYADYTAFGVPASATSANACSETASYNALGQLAGQRITTADGRPVVDNTYTRDRLDQVLGIADALGLGQGQAFTYDAAGRLATAAGPYPQQAYRYDTAGNVLQKADVSFAYDGQQVVQGTRGGEPVFEAAYDANGRMTRRAWQGATTSCTFDAENRLVAAGDHSFIYDHTGRRLVKRTPALTTFYVSDAFERTEFAGGASQRTRNLVGPWGTAATSTIVEAGAPPPTAGVPAPGTFHSHSDHVNSTTLLTDAGGALAARAVYLPFGEVLILAGADAFRHKFTGQEIDATGLYYFQARYYDPVTARFTTADDRPGGRLFDTDSFNAYAYVGNNPLARIDPTGHRWWDIMFQSLLSVGAVVAGVVATPFSGAVGGMLVGAGIGGLAYDVTQVATGHGDDSGHGSWGGWGTQFGIGAAVGLVTGGLGRVASRLLNELPEVEGVGWTGRNTWFSDTLTAGRFARVTASISRMSSAGRMATAALMGGVNGSVGGVMAQLLQDAASDRSAAHGLGMASVVGFGVGAIGGATSQYLLQKLGTPAHNVAELEMYENQAQSAAGRGAVAASTAEVRAPVDVPLQTTGWRFGVKVASSKIITATGRGILWAYNDQLPF